MGVFTTTQALGTPLLLAAGEIEMILKTSKLRRDEWRNAFEVSGNDRYDATVLKDQISREQGCKRSKLHSARRGAADTFDAQALSDNSIAIWKDGKVVYRCRPKR